jgi:hypothetical protein
VPLTGAHATKTILVTIPAPSIRPDRKHFFYAIVWASGERAWTSPIFSDDSVSHAASANLTLP